MSTLQMVGPSMATIGSPVSEWTYASAAPIATSAAGDQTIKAAVTTGSRKRHYISMLYVTAAIDLATNPTTIELYDGTSAAGALIWRGYLDDAAKAGDVAGFALPLPIAASPGKALTVKVLSATTTASAIQINAAGYTA